MRFVNIWLNSEKKKLHMDFLIVHADKHLKYMLLQVHFHRTAKILVQIKYLNKAIAGKVVFSMDALASVLRNMVPATTASAKTALLLTTPTPLIAIVNTIQQQEFYVVLICSLWTASTFLVYAIM